MGPSQPELLRGDGKPMCRRSRASKAAPKCEGLCVGSMNSGWVRSGTKADRPKQLQPKIGSGGSERPCCCSNIMRPKLKVSRIGTAGSNRAGDRSSAAAPIIARSSTGSSNPVQPMPKANRLNSSFAEL